MCIYLCSRAVVYELRRFGHRGKHDINTGQFLLGDQCIVTSRRVSLVLSVCV